MRLTSEFWVSQLIRRAFNGGGYAAIVRKGAAEAGSIFIILRGRNGQIDLFGPAPQTEYDTDRPQDRVFTLILEKASDDKVEAKLASEARFDSDLWVAEVEPGNGPALFEVR